MRFPCLLIVVLLLSCTTSKTKYNNYKGKPEEYLISQEGLPYDSSYKDGYKKLEYAQYRKMHNPKYSSVYRYTCFFIDSNKIVRSFKTEIVKTTPSTPPGSTTIY